MKITNLAAVLLVLASLPFGLTAQTPSRTPNSNSSTTDTNRSQSGSNRSTGSTLDSPTAGMVRDLRPVSKEALESQFTVKDLLNEDIYDRDDKKIGKVVDVILDRQSTSLTAAFSQNSDRMDATPSSMSNRDGALNDRSRTDSSMGGATASGRVSNREVTSATNPGAMSNDFSGTKSVSGISSDETSVVISHGGLLSRGQDLICAPISRVTYNSSSKHFVLDVSNAELTGLTSAESAGR